MNEESKKKKTGRPQVFAKFRTIRFTDDIEARLEKVRVAIDPEFSLPATVRRLLVLGLDQFENNLKKARKP
jgi:hypothetical protein